MESVKHRDTDYPRPPWVNPLKAGGVPPRGSTGEGAGIEPHQYGRDLGVRVSWTAKGWVQGGAVTPCADRFQTLPGRFSSKLFTGVFI